ncbi:SET domain-containing protein [Plenodomus tracheiphilus IPT5]|uniref:SET domain-containing protein n=1 Tax=Plenodomus tracheiphilus IPT5 TaxID=1408161 RepID=A0A6A7BPK9_9PLEO|nr:SET domain-containing protein [Plenodomus tracheiphilus IPT5]
MRTHPAFLAALTYTTLAFSQLTLHHQCWHETAFLTVNLQSLPGSQHELASPIHPTDHHTSPPWSFPTICTPTLPSLNSPLCIYTSTTFASGRGISIFTTPSLANHFASLPVFHNPSILSSQNINTNTGNWRTEALPGKGMGMLASRPLSFGDKITVYTPAFLAVLEGDLSTMEREKYWRIAISQLPAPIREEFLGLATVYGDERVRVQDIVKANTFQLDVEGVNHLAVWPETSRLNHDCGPNAQYVLDPKTLTHTVHATRPIASGEEISISYTSPFDNTADRQAHLSSFGFTCSCRRCSSPSSSDDILAQISAVQANLNTYPPSPSSPTSPALIQQLLDLHVSEGLEGFMDIAYGFAALTYSSFGDADRAREYVEKAKRAVEMKDGVWSVNWGVWEGMLDEGRGGVRGHWSWGVRTRG